MKEKIKELLGVGLPNNVVASATGVTESYVSQLLSEETFAAEVQELRLKNLTEASTRDGKWNRLEDSLLEKIEHLLPLMVKPMEVLQALKIVNSAQRRAAPRELAANAQHHHVHLHLPTVVQQKFVVNAQSQIVEADGRTIATMGANKVVEMLKKRVEEPASTPENQRALQDDRIEAFTRLQNLRNITLLPTAEQL